MNNPCKNDTTKIYNGREESPLGNGFSPDIERNGMIMTGKDDILYISVRNI